MLAGTSCATTTRSWSWKGSPCLAVRRLSDSLIARTIRHQDPMASPAGAGRESQIWLVLTSIAASVGSRTAINQRATSTSRLAFLSQKGPESKMPMKLYAQRRTLDHSAQTIAIIRPWLPWLMVPSQDQWPSGRTILKRDLFADAMGLTT